MDFIPRKIVAANINNGQRFTPADGVTANAVNAPIEAAIYVQALTENPIDYSEIGTDTSPEVTIVEGAAGPYFKFKGFASFTSISKSDVLDLIAVHNADELAHPYIQALTARDKWPTQYSDKLVTSNGIYDALVLKQDRLTFDDEPVAGSYNPVYSGGAYTAVERIKNYSYAQAQEALTESKRYTNEMFDRHGTDSVNGSVTPEPDTIAQRDSEGVLYGENPIGTNTGSPASDMYPTALINAETLEKYAQKKVPNEPRYALYGFDENGNPVAYNIADAYSGNQRDDTIPNEKAVAQTVESAVDSCRQGLENRISALDNYVEESFAKKEDLETVESIAKGANQAKAFYSYEHVVAILNAAESSTYNVGQNIYVAPLDTPDLWIYDEYPDKELYAFTTEEAFKQDLETNKFVRIGHYQLAMLETQKVDLTDYATKEELEAVDNASSEFADWVTENVPMKSDVYTKDEVDDKIAGLTPGGSGTTAEAYELIEEITVSEEAVVARTYTQRYKKLIIRAFCNDKLPKFRLLGGAWFAEFYSFSNYANPRALYIGEIIIPNVASETRCLTGAQGGNPTEGYAITERAFGGAYFDGFKTDAACYVGTSIQVYGVKQ